MRAADFQLSTHGDAVVARLEGEIDLANAEEVGGALADAASNEAVALVLDLSAVDYFDSAGIQLIYQLREKLRTRNQALALVIPSTSAVRDSLRLAGVERHVGASEAVEEALHELHE